MVFDSSTGSWFFLGLFFLLITALTLINARINREFKIEGTWVALAATPAVLWMVLSGRVTEMTLPGGMGFKAAALQSVSLKSDGEKVSPEKIEVGVKSPTQNLSELKRLGTAALKLQIGSSYYNDDALREYLTELTNLKFLIFADSADAYLGFAPADGVRRQLHESSVSLASAIEQGQVDKIAGFSNSSVSEDDSRAKALRIMDDKQLSVLPVVDANRRFIGVVDRDKLTSSIVAQLVAESANSR